MPSSTPIPPTILLCAGIKITDRQRQEFDKGAMEELKQSILTDGLLHPIVVNADLEKDIYELVCGERRLRVISGLNEDEVVFHKSRPLPHNHIPVTVITNMTESMKFSAELAENLKRRDLSWAEKSTALAKLHAFRKEENPDQRYEDTAKEVKASKGDASPIKSQERMEIRQAELLEPHLADPEIAKAKTQKEAIKLVMAKIEQEFNDALDLTTVEGFSEDQPHTLLCGDMQEVVLQNKHYNLAICDPPYGVGVKDFGGAQAMKHEYSEDNFKELYKATADILTYCCQENAHAYIFVDFSMFEEVSELFSKRGWKVRRTPLIWNKGPRGHLPEGGVLGYRRSSEYIVFAHRGMKQCNGLQSDVLTVVDHSKKWHAAQKPVELYKILMEQSANIGDTVIDLFAGSGVIFEAASICSLLATGVEMNEKTVRQIEIKRGVYRAS